MPVHPMDEIPIRKFRFKFDAVEGHDPVWSRSCPDFSIFINALGVHVPHFERFLVKSMRAYRDELQDEKLSLDVKAIIGQESHHAFNFEKWTAEMCKRYKGLAAINDHAKTYFLNAFENGSRKFRIGFTAGYETFTFLGGIIVLQRYAELMEEADPTIRALWVWHQVEEIEHGSVAFDFYRAFYPKDEWYRRMMVVFAYIHIIWETFKAYAHMIKTEGFYRKPMRALKAWRFFISFGLDFGISALPTLSRHYHPRNHPSCTTNQTLIAVAWKEFHAAGNDVQLLRDADVDQMLGALQSA